MRIRRNRQIDFVFLYGTGTGTRKIKPQNKIIEEKRQDKPDPVLQILERNETIS
jgi:hypothetical protein